jgi:site-specific recombinase XerC
MGGDIDLRVIQKFLGRVQVGTTEGYTHVVLEHLSEASAMIDRMWKRKLLSAGKDLKQDHSPC